MEPGSCFPFLIVLNSAKASKIAPTIVIPAMNDATSDERFFAIANALNTTELAETLINAFHAKPEESKVKLKAAGLCDRTITVVNFHNKKECFINI